jgi:hypothetical protein
MLPDFQTASHLLEGRQTWHAYSPIKGSFEYEDYYGAHWQGKAVDPEKELS